MAHRASIKHFYDKKHSKEYGTQVVYLSVDPSHYHHKILNRINNNQIILDVGCATGYLGASAKKNGNSVYGIEISEIAIEKAREVLDGVVEGNIEEMEIPYPEEYFDIIICSDVLEHLFDPQEVLLKLRRHLKKSGKLMISVPNVAHYSIRWMLMKGNWEYKAFGLMDYGHLRFFTKKTMSHLLEASGYRIKEISPYISLPLPINVIDGKFLNRSLRKICTNSQLFDTFFTQTFLFIAEVKPG